MKLATVAVFGAGYVLGSRAGRERYEQIRELARGVPERLETTGLRRQIGEYGARLDAYAARRPAARQGQR